VPETGLEGAQEGLLKRSGGRQARSHGEEIRRVARPENRHGVFWFYRILKISLQFDQQRVPFSLIHSLKQNRNIHFLPLLIYPVHYIIQSSASLQ
jgi:hypothetical protein